MAGQVGWKTESTWGTAVVVDTFMPVTGTDMSIDQGYLRSKSIRAGRRTRDPGRLGALTVSGKVDMELPNTSIATLFKHLFGTVGTTGSGPYVHTFSPGPHVGKSLTLQVGIEDTAGTVQPFTMSGAKVGGWTIDCKVGELATLSFDYTAKDYTTGTALAAASYAAGLVPFTFIEGAITVNGTAVASAKSATLSTAKGLNDKRHVIGSRFIREQREQDHFDITTEITADFDNLTLFNLIAAGTQVASVFTFTNGAQSLVITCSGQIVGDAPSLTNPGIEEQTIRLDHSSAVSDAAAITAVLTNSEATAV
jgi:hypothetical protein